MDCVVSLIFLDFCCKIHLMKIKHLKKKKRFSVIKDNKEIGYITYEYPDDESGKRNIDVLYLYVKPAEKCYKFI